MHIIVGYLPLAMGFKLAKCMLTNVRNKMFKILDNGL
jgi:hypothetical protein